MNHDDVIRKGSGVDQGREPFGVQRAGKTVSKLELAERVCDVSEASLNVVEVNVSRLRDKLATAAHLLETVRGHGYRLREGAP